MPDQTSIGETTAREREDALIREFAAIVQKRWESEGVSVFDGIVERLSIEEGIKRERDSLLEEIARVRAAVQITREALRALDPSFPVGAALDLIEHAEEAGRAMNVQEPRDGVR